MTTETQTAGTEFAEAIRSYFRIGTRTRRYRDGRDMHAEIVEAIEYAQLPGYYSEGTERALRLAGGALRSYQKHVQGYRLDGDLIARINRMSSYQFTGLLADMIDAGVTNVGEGERYFQGMAR